MTQSTKRLINSMLDRREAAKLENAVRAGKTILVCERQGPTGKTTLCEALKKEGVPAVEEQDVCQIHLDRLLR